MNQKCFKVGNGFLTTLNGQSSLLPARIWVEYIRRTILSPSRGTIIIITLPTSGYLYVKDMYLKSCFIRHNYDFITLAFIFFSKYITFNSLVLLVLSDF